MLRLKTIYLIFYLQIAVFSVYSQNSVIHDLIAKSNTFSKDYPQEKVYLHFDNTSYYLGETIWFKAYVVRADRHYLSDLSAVLYVELVTAEGNILSTRKLKVVNGQCHGDFRIPTTQYAGFFEVRAYTRYMLNWGSDNYFSRVFPVYDEPKEFGKFSSNMTERPNSQRIPQKRPVYEQKKKLTINFYPEGGSLVRGLSSRVAFKATNSEGENAIVAGDIYNERNEKVTDFSTEYNGMGMFSLLADSGKYTAKVSYNNQDYRFVLPSILSTGYTMNVENIDNNTTSVTIRRSEKLNYPDSLSLVISCRGIQYIVEKIGFGNENILSVSIPKNRLPSGVSQISLVCSGGNVLCERMIFINHNSQLKIACSQDKADYKPFEKIEMNFEIKNKVNKAVETVFSVAVRDNSTSSVQPYNDNILSNLLLSSDLKGYIENPAYYFEKDDTPHRQALDLLMLVQGWSRYSLKQLDDGFRVKYPIEKGLVMEGMVTSLLAKRKVTNAEVSMVLLADSTSQKGKCMTDDNGMFGFTLHDFYGEAKLILQTTQGGKKKENNIQLDRNFSPPFRYYSFSENHAQNYKPDRTDSTLNISKIDITDQNKDGNPKLVTDANLPIDKRDNLLKTVTVNEKKKTIHIKPSLQYTVSQEMDKITDLGDWQPAGINELFSKLNDYFVYGDPSRGPRYKNKKVLFLRDNSPTVTGDISDLLSANAENTESNSTNAAGVSVLSNEKANNDALKAKQDLPRLDEIESISLIENINDILRICPNLINDKDYTNMIIVLLHCKKNYHPEPYGIRETTFAGFSNIKEFYSPNYTKILLPDEKDHRRTLYWNPDVLTDKDGKASIQFYNNENCTSMNVSVETVSSNGAIGMMNK